jgi:hypothetical protein
METNKLRIKIGDQEFEAEGSPEIVQAQLAAFKELVATAPLYRKAPEPKADPAEYSTQVSQQQNNGPLALDKIMKVDGRIVSITGHAKSPEDAMLLLLLGQKTFRNNDGVTGAEIVDGLRVSGKSKDGTGRTLKKLATEGSVIITGAHRGKRYRLTNQGVTRAQEIARGVIALVA